MLPPGEITRHAKDRNGVQQISRVAMDRASGTEGRCALVIAENNG